MSNISLYEKLLGITPSYDYLKSFGCLRFATSLKVGREKFQSRSISCVFLGCPCGDLHEEVCMNVPLGLDVSSSSNSSSTTLVCHLRNSLYNLRQASRKWFSKLSEALRYKGCIFSKNDYSLFTKSSAGSLIILMVYVDDILLVQMLEFSIILRISSASAEATVAAFHIAKNPMFHEFTNHIDVDFHYVRDCLVAGLVSLLYIPSSHSNICAGNGVTTGKVYGHSPNVVGALDVSIRDFTQRNGGRLVLTAFFIAVVLIYDDAIEHIFHLNCIK
ncbi:hypothetical protein FXO38_07489 [Capsicum annuum]|nr:hypothetical protein FXO37_28418 [Capsicum annuum]KAF3669657.1 hypothetical protein FXO38_07489 [Capsicum annuum]